MDNLLDKYLFQAIDAYPYDLEETIESLQYALSYNQNSTHALCLMGRVYAEQLHNYEMAKSYYQDALAIDIHALNVYTHYIAVLLRNEDYKEAEKLINFAFTVKGIDKAMLYLKKAQLLERKREYKIALQHLKKATEMAYDSDYEQEIKELKTRIKAKMPKKKTKKGEKETPCKKKKKKRK